MMLGGLQKISYASIFSSFHQFITNPTKETINRSLITGMKEVSLTTVALIFYSRIKNLIWNLEVDVCIRIYVRLWKTEVKSYIVSHAESVAVVRMAWTSSTCTKYITKT